MKIKHINSPKSGTIEHVRPDVGRTLVAAGFAEAVPLPARGSKDWLAARNEQAALTTKPDAHDTVIENVIGVRWECISLPITGIPAILRRSGCEVTRLHEGLFFGDPSCGIKHGILCRCKSARQKFVSAIAGCPDSILRQYDDLKNSRGPDAIEAANERVLQERIALEAADKKVKSVLRTQFGIDPDAKQ